MHILLKKQKRYWVPSTEAHVEDTFIIENDILSIDEGDFACVKLDFGDKVQCSWWNDGDDEFTDCTITAIEDELLIVEASTGIKSKANIEHIRLRVKDYKGRLIAPEEGFQHCATNMLHAISGAQEEEQKAKDAIKEAERKRKEDEQRKIDEANQVQKQTAIAQNEAANETPQTKEKTSSEGGFVQLLLCFLLPPAAVWKKGCGSVIVVWILTSFGWWPGVIAALWICKKSGATEAAPEKKTEKKTISKKGFNVEFTGLSDPKAKVKVIKEIRGITGLGLKDAKALVESAPGLIKEAVNKDVAEDIKAKIEAVGGKVTIK